MKKLIVLLALALSTSIACAASLPPTQANIEKAKNSPSDASNFSKLSERPSGADADKPGDTVIFVKDGKSFQFGSSLTPAEAYDAQVSGGGGE